MEKICMIGLIGIINQFISLSHASLGGNSLYLPGVKHGISVTTIVCLPSQYGPCDLTPIISDEYKGSKIYVSELDDPGEVCKKPVTRVNGDNMYYGNSRQQTVQICIEYQPEIYEHIGTVHYSGILNTYLGVFVSYGMSWHVAATLLLPKHETPTENMFYSKILLKNVNCYGNTVSFALLNARGSTKLGTGKWKVVFVSKDFYYGPIIEPNICICIRIGGCQDDSEYDKLLVSPKVEGPIIDAPLSLGCTLGRRCIVNFAGSFTIFKRLFVASSTPNLDKGVFMNYLDSGNYEYLAKKEEFIVTSTTNYSLGIYWLPSGSDDSQIKIGKLNLLSIYAGTTYVAPFGDQVIKLKNIDAFEHRFGEFFIYERSIVPDVGLGSGSFGVKAADWTLVNKAKLENYSIRIDVNFVSNKEFALKYCNKYDEMLECPSAPSYESHALLADLIPLGISEYSNNACVIDEPCNLALKTQNMTKDAIRIKQLFLARECGSGLGKSSFITADGFPSHTRILLPSITEFSWQIWLRKSSHLIGNVLKLCWRGIRKLTFGNFPTNHIIEVGSILFIGKVEGNLECWIGSVCSPYLAGDFGNWKGELFLSGSCESDEVFKFEDGSTVFETRVFNYEHGTMTSLTGTIGADRNLVGKYKICFRLKSSSKITPSLPISVGDLSIKVPRLRNYRYYLGVGKIADIRCADCPDAEQYLLLSRFCGETGDTNKFKYRLNTWGILIRFAAEANNLKICWCKVFGEMICDRAEDYKLMVGELVSSGFLANEEALECYERSSCVIGLPYQSFFGIFRAELQHLNGNFELLIRKGECAHKKGVNDVLIPMSSRTSPVALERSGSLFIVRYTIFFTFHPDDRFKPGYYHLCYRVEGNENLFPLSKLHIKGVYEANNSVLVYLGKPFTIILRGYKLDGNIRALIANNKSCLDLGGSGDSFVVTMSPKPNIHYEDNGVSVLIWLGVTITRIMDRNSENSLYDGLGFLAEAMRSFYLCVSGKETFYYVGTRYFVVGPNISRSVDAIPGIRNKVRIVLDSKWPFVKNHLLAISFIDPFSTPIHSCESGYWYKNPRDSNITFSFYSFNGELAPLRTFLETENLLICWCGGENCSVLADFRNTIKFPSFSGPLFKIIPFETGSLDVAFTGQSLRSNDEIRVVDTKVECGRSNSSMMTVSLSVNVNLSRYRTELVAISSEMISAYRNIVGSAKEFTSTHGNNVWNSFPMKLQEPKTRAYLYYKICYCSFLRSESCSRDEDFGDWIGGIVDYKRINVVPRMFLVNISITQSHMDKGRPSTCDTHLNIDSLSTTSVYRIHGGRVTVLDLVRKHIKRYSRFEGFLLEVCYAKLIQNSPKSLIYKKLLARNKSGIYHMQRISIKRGAEENIFIRGIGLSEFPKIQMVIIPTSEFCSDDAERYAIAKANALHGRNSRFVLFKNLKVNDDGSYRLCMKIGGTGKEANIVANTVANTALPQVNYDKNAANTSNDASAFGLSSLDKREAFTEMCSTSSALASHTAKSNSKIMVGSTSSRRKSYRKREWYDGGFMVVKNYYSRAVADLVAFPLLWEEPCREDRAENREQCSPKEYTDLVQLCALLDNHVLIFTDYMNRLLLTEIRVEEGVIKADKIRKYTSLELKADGESKWLLCKGFTRKRRMLLLGEVFLLIIELPLDFQTPKVIKAIRHMLMNPLDVSMADYEIFISDGYTRSFIAYIFEKDSMESAYRTELVFRDVYWIALHVINNEGNSTQELLALDPEINTIFRYRVNLKDYKISCIFLDKFTGEDTGHTMNVGYLDRPSSMDAYLETSYGQRVNLLFVAENMTGRIIVFKLVEGIKGYKVMHTTGLITRINVDSFRKMFFISSLRKYLDALEQFILYKPIDSYVNLDFYYNILDKYQNETQITLEPVLRGDQFEFFFEENINTYPTAGTHGKNTSESSITLSSIGLVLDVSLGIISGKLTATGVYNFLIYGGNLLKQVHTTVTISISCPPSNQVNLLDMKCEKCPIGTYRNDEPDDRCVPCSLKRPNSTTEMVGASLFSDCLCDRGFYLNEGRCVPCEVGTFKAEVGDSVCSGTCGSNMTSQVVGAVTREDLNCHCLPKFFNLKFFIDNKKSVPSDILELVGLKLSADYGIVLPRAGELEKASNIHICIPCVIGYYCPGGSFGPQSCGVGRSTKDRYSYSESDCACDTGYGYDEFGNCVECPQFGYKDVVDNIPCSQCHRHDLDKRATSSLPSIPFMGNFGISDSEDWIKHLESIQENHPEAYNRYIDHMDKLIMVTNLQAATSVGQCQFCVAGYYFDNNYKNCFPCPADNFCPGLDIQPISCGLNGVTKSSKSTTAMDCFCQSGYGNAFDGRNPINNTVVCRQCPFGYFQHLAMSDSPCIPCPPHSTTFAIGSSTLFDCVPDPGYYLKIVHEVKELFEGENEGTEYYDFNSSGEKLPWNFEEYKFKARKEGVWVKREIVNSTTIQAPLTTFLMRESLEACSKECLSNLYCRGFTFQKAVHFAHKRATIFNTGETIYFNGIRYIKTQLHTCTLYLFELSYTASTYKAQISKPNQILLWVIGGLEAFEYTASPCPMDHYCTGSQKPIPCTANSKTLGGGSKSIDACLCVSGYEPSVDHRTTCVACKFGWYKQEIGNLSCKRCPERLRTFEIGATHVTECACAPGYYARISIGEEGGVEPNFLYKRHKDGRISLVRDEEINESYRNSYRRAMYVAIESFGFHGLDMDYRDHYEEYAEITKNLDSLMFLSKPLILIHYSLPSFLLKNMKNDYKTFYCERCKLNQFCPGGWVGGTVQRLIHNIPYRCPFGSRIPSQSSSATSITQCLCLPGYKIGIDSNNYRTLTGNREEEYALNNYKNQNNANLEQDQKYKDLEGAYNHLSFEGDINNAVKWGASMPSCIKCEGGMYKEGHENSSCSGRCMQYATTYGGSVSKNQCFCQYGRFMKLENTMGSQQMTCAKCMSGAICPGGLYIWPIMELSDDQNFKDIPLTDHAMPQPRFGFFAAYKQQNMEYWSPSNEQVVDIVDTPTDFLDFHACPIEFRCEGGPDEHCSIGASGYLCNNCLSGYDSLHFRGPCTACKSMLMELLDYVQSKFVLWLVAGILLFFVKQGLVVPCVILKIWIEFWFSMVPYGTIHLNSESSIKKFAVYYNSLFSYSQTLFGYIRTWCFFSVITETFDFSFIHFWYLQKFLQILQPLVDAVFLYIFYCAFYVLTRLLAYLESTCNKFVYSRTIDPISHKILGLDTNKDQCGTDFWKGHTGNDLSANSASLKRSRRKVGVSGFRFVRFSECILIMSYLGFQYICQELLQMLWCVNVQYKNEDPISVLLHMPSQICTKEDKLYYYSSIAALLLSLLLLFVHVVLPFYWARNIGDHFLFVCGHRQHRKAWDAILFLKRFLIAILIVFQATTTSTGSSERLRVILSLLLSTFFTIIHMKLVPFQIRSDNLFNRLELGSLSVNNITAFLIQGSFGYDFNYVSLLPLGASGFFTLLLCWYIMVEFGYIADLRPRLWMNSNHRMGSIFWRFCHRLIVWHNNAQITFNYDKKEFVIEAPFMGHIAAHHQYNFRRSKDSAVSYSGRRALSLCVEQSINKLVMEQKCLSVPRFWLEFLIRYTFAYKYNNLATKSWKTARKNAMIDGLLRQEIYNNGPITPWQISAATLNAELEHSMTSYKKFDDQTAGYLERLRRSHTEICFEFSGALSKDKDVNVNELIQRVHKFHELQEKLQKLNVELANQVRNAREGARATKQILDLEIGIENTVNAPLTNEDILLSIQLEQKRCKDGMEREISE